MDVDTVRTYSDCPSSLTEFNLHQLAGFRRRAHRGVRTGLSPYSSLLAHPDARHTFCRGPVDILLRSPCYNDSDLIPAALLAFPLAHDASFSLLLTLFPDLSPSFLIDYAQVRASGASAMPAQATAVALIKAGEYHIPGLHRPRLRAESTPSPSSFRLPMYNIGVRPRPSCTLSPPDSPPILPALLPFMTASERLPAPGLPTVPYNSRRPSLASRVADLERRHLYSLCARPMDLYYYIL